MNANMETTVKADARKGKTIFFPLGVILAILVAIGFTAEYMKSSKDTPVHASARTIITDSSTASLAH